MSFDFAFCTIPDHDTDDSEEFEPPAMAIKPTLFKKKAKSSDESSSELEVIYDKYTEETKVKKKGLYLMSSRKICLECTFLFLKVKLCNLMFKNNYFNIHVCLLSMNH